MTTAKTKTLGSVISVSKGKKHLVVEAPSSSSKRLLGIDDLRNDNLLRYTDDPSGTGVLPEDVLIAWDGANAGTIGFGKSGYIGSTIARLRINEGEKIFAPFLGTFLKSKFDYLRQTATGATIPHINRKALDDIEMPDVDFNDQIRTAHLLGKVEGLIAQRKQHLQQLDDLLTSVFLEMFGDPVRNEKGWAERELGTAFKIKHGFAFTSEFFSDDGPYVLLTPGNFFEEGGFRDRGNKQKYYVGETPQEYILNRGDLLLAMTEQAPGLLGSPLIVPEESLYLHNQRLGLVVGKEPIQSRFIFHLFNQKSIRQVVHSKATGTKVRHTSPTKIESIVVGYPPINIQSQFAAIDEKVEGIKSRYQQSLADLETLYGALSQQAFKGELDLSRVPMPGIKPEVEKAVVTVPLQARAEESLAINLPDTDNLLDALENVEAREALIAQWLVAYRSQRGNTPFSVQRFMAAAQTRLVELHPETDFELGANDYERIKTWVFEALATGTLMQAFDDAGNRIELRKRSDDWGSW